MIANEMAQKYGLTLPTVFGAIEMAMTKVLTRALRNNVVVKYDGEDFDITVLHEASAPRQLDLKDIPRKLQRHLMHEISNELIFRKTCFDAERLKPLQGKVVEGELSKIAKNGCLIVTINTEQMFCNEQWHAECLPRAIPAHEKKDMSLGTKKKWLVTSVLSVSDGSDTRLRLRLSRISPDLPVAMLTEYTGIPGIICTKRIPGAYSNIHSPKRLPREAISFVKAELRESINVKFSG